MHVRIIPFVLLVGNPRFADDYSSPLWFYQVSVLHNSVLFFLPGHVIILHLPVKGQCCLHLVFSAVGQEAGMWGATVFLLDVGGEEAAEWQIKSVWFLSRAALYEWAAEGLFTSSAGQRFPCVGCGTLDPPAALIGILFACVWGRQRLKQALCSSLMQFVFLMSIILKCVKVSEIFEGPMQVSWKWEIKHKDFFMNILLGISQISSYWTLNRLVGCSVCVFGSGLPYSVKSSFALCARPVWNVKQGALPCGAPPLRVVCVEWGGVCVWSVCGLHCTVTAQLGKRLKSSAAAGWTAWTSTAVLSDRMCASVPTRCNCVRTCVTGDVHVLAARWLWTVCLNSATISPGCGCSWRWWQVQCCVTVTVGQSVV